MIKWQRITYFEIIIGGEINNAKRDVPQNGGTAALLKVRNIILMPSIICLTLKMLRIPPSSCHIVVPDCIV